MGPVLMRNRHSLPRRLTGIGLAAVCVMALSGCEEREVKSGRAWRPIPGDTLALMQQVGTTKRAPVLIRTYKKEAEFEIWKMKADGRYTLLKTFPMCRWSGQLGPKTREGDRQVPEGFYNITPAQMNPNSNYYLSFNVGYPNSYDRAYGRTGGLIMVHGDCSSAGCFSMTDAQIAEIYALLREAFGGGQQTVQMQSLPFRMTAENLARHRADPHIGFWKQLKEGVDNFDVSKQEPLVNVCNRRYVFNSTPIDPKSQFEANSICPPLQQDENLKAEVAAKQASDSQKVAELVQKGVKAVKVVYADGGQHPDFASVSLVSRPEALEAGATEIELLENGKPKPALVQLASAKTDAGQKQGAKTAAASAVQPGAPSQATTALDKSVPAKTAVSAAAPVPAAAVPQGSANPDSPFYKRWLGLASEAPAPEAVQVTEPSTPQPANVPLPPRRADRPAAVSPHASLAPGALPAIMRGAQPVLAPGLTAYAPF